MSIGEIGPSSTAGRWFCMVALCWLFTGCGGGTPQAPPQTEKVSVIAVGDIAQCNGLLARNKAWEATA